MKVHYACTSRRDAGLWHHECVSEAVIESDCDIARDLNVLSLVFAYRYELCVVKQNVRSLQCGIREQAGGDKISLTLCALVLELRHPTEFTEGDGAFHHPTKLAVLGDVALHENGGDLGVKPDGEQCRCEFEGLRPDDSGLIRDREGVKVHNPVVGLAVLALDPRHQRTEQISQVNVTRWLNAGKDTVHDSTLVGQRLGDRQWN